MKFTRFLGFKKGEYQNSIITLRLICEQVEEWLEEVAQKLYDENVYTLKVEVSIANKELSRMHRFYRGAVLPYFFIQHHHRLPKDQKELKEISDMLKEEVGFFLYDKHGNKVQLNSLGNIFTTKKFYEFLEEVRQIFEEHGYLFPDSDEYNELVKKHGEKAAKQISLNNLIGYMKRRGVEIS